MLKRSFILLFPFFLFLPLFAHAAAGADLRVLPADIRFSKSPLIVGDNIRIYTKVHNIGTIDVVGYVSFYQGSDLISEPQVISVVSGSDPEEVFVDFVVPASSFNLRAVISGTKPADINLDNNVAITGMFTPIFDDDHDGIQNGADNCPTISNTTQVNTDRDAFGDACDDDKDGDSLSNAVESEIGTNPIIIDTDGDGTDDAHDAYPLDPKRWVLEKTPPKIVPKPVVKTEEKSALVTSPTVDQKNSSTTKTAAINTVQVSDAVISEGVPVSGLVNQGEIEISENEGLSSNAVFTYEKKSWNTFDFRVIAPIQDGSVYEWNFGDNVRSSKTSVTHAYSKSGSFKVILKTINKNGEVKEESAEIHVTFFSFNNPWIIALLTLLGISLLGACIALFKLKSKNRPGKGGSDKALKQIHVSEE